MSLSNAIAAIQTAMAGIPGIRSAPEDPPDSPGNLPLIITYPSTGTGDILVPGEAELLTNLVVELHLQRVDLARTISNSLDFFELIVAVLFEDVTFSGTVSTFGRLRYDFLPMNYAGIDTFGIRFTLENVKIHKIL